MMPKVGLDPTRAKRPPDFELVEFFGGKEAFEEQQKRDAKKKDKCKRNDVELVYLKPDYDFGEVKNIIDQNLRD